MKNWIYTVVMSMFVLVIGGCSDSELKRHHRSLLKLVEKNCNLKKADMSGVFGSGLVGSLS